MTRSELAALVESVLSRTQGAKLLRGVTEQGNDFGDLDFIVSPGQSTASALKVVHAVEELGWNLIFRVHLGYVCSIFLHLPSETSDVVHKVDFIEGISWRGVVCDPVLADPFSSLWRDIHDDWSDQRIIGFYTFLQKIMSAGYVSEKEWYKIRQTGADSNYIGSICAQVGLPLNGEQITKRKLSSYQKWRLRSISGGADTFSNLLHWTFKVALAVCAGKSGFAGFNGFVIGFSGTEDKDKISLIDRYRKLLKECHAPSPVSVQFSDGRYETLCVNNTTPVERLTASGVARQFVCQVYVAFNFLKFRFIGLGYRLMCFRSRLILLNGSVYEYLARNWSFDGERRFTRRLLALLFTPNGLNILIDTSTDTDDEETILKAAALRNCYSSLCSNTSVIYSSADNERNFQEFLVDVSKHMKNSLKG